MEYTYKEMRAFAVDFAYYIHIKKLGDLSHEKHKELFDEWVKEKLPQAFVSGRSEQLFCDCEIQGSSFQLNTGEICCCKCEKERAK